MRQCTAYSRARCAARTVAIAMASCAALAGCATGMAGSTHYAPVNFRGYDTFAWATDDAIVAGAAEADPRTVVMIRESVERQLQRRGLRAAEADEDADLLLAFTLGPRDGVGPEAYPEQLRGAWRWQGLDNARTAGYAPGTLAIDLFDRAAGQPVWHGWSRQPLAGDDAGQPAEEAVANTVEAILRRYPPRRTDTVNLGTTYSVFGAPH